MPLSSNARAGAVGVQYCTGRRLLPAKCKIDLASVLQSELNELHRRCLREHVYNLIKVYALTVEISTYQDLST